MVVDLKENCFSFQIGCTKISCLHLITTDSAIKILANTTTQDWAIRTSIQILLRLTAQWVWLVQTRSCDETGDRCLFYCWCRACAGTHPPGPLLLLNPPDPPPINWGIVRGLWGTINVLLQWTPRHDFPLTWMKKPMIFPRYNLCKTSRAVWSTWTAEFVNLSVLFFHWIFML